MTCEDLFDWLIRAELAKRGGKILWENDDG
jgi:hypothetical protein